MADTLRPAPGRARSDPDATSFRGSFPFEYKGRSFRIAAWRSGRQGVFYRAHEGSLSLKGMTFVTGEGDLYHDPELLRQALRRAVDATARDHSLTSRPNPEVHDVPQSETHGETKGEAARDG
jgi:hypothetical protein